MFKSRTGKVWSVGQVWSVFVFLQIKEPFLVIIKFDCNTATPICSIYGCFHVTMSEFKSYDRDYVVCKAENNYYLAFLRKSMLTLLNSRRKSTSYLKPAIRMVIYSKCSVGQKSIRTKISECSMELLKWYSCLLEFYSAENRMVKNEYFENQTSKILCGDTELMIN